jgi:Icc-related predicted phosphoesterase
MNLTIFSDTHGHHRNVDLPNSDVLIFAGDCMTCGYKKNELLDFLDWLSSQPHKHKIMIAGNHDRYIENYGSLFRQILQGFPDIIYLENSGVQISGINFWGTPDSKEFCSWAFNRTDKQLKSIFGRIPSNTNVLISHAPQFKILDQLEDGTSVGEKSLSENIIRLKDLHLHVFGHIHCSYGVIKNGHTSMNSSLVSEQYYLINKPHTFYLNSDQKKNASQE